MAWRAAEDNVRKRDKGIGLRIWTIANNRRGAMTAFKGYEKKNDIMNVAP